MHADGPTASGSPSSGAERALLVAIVVLALGIRAWWIDWGLPRTNLHPDEATILAIGERLSWSSLDPGHYSYSGLFHFQNFVGGELLRLAGIAIDSPTRLLAHRLWNLLWGPLTCFVVFAGARELFSRRAALTAALLMALAPVHVWNSYYGTADVALTFWITVAWWLAIRAYGRPAPGVFIACGLAVGLAAGFKFNGALAAVSPAACALAIATEGRVSRGRALGLLGLAALASLASYALVSPSSVVRSGATAAAFSSEWQHVLRGHFGYDLAPSGWQYHPYIYQLAAALPFALGVALYALLLYGCGLLIARGRRTELIVLLAFPVVHLAVFGFWTFVPVRYVLPLVPAFIVAGVGGLDRRVAEGGEASRRIVWLAAVATAYTIAFTLTTTARFGNDTRLQAARWADRELPQGARLWLLEPIVSDSYMPRVRADVRVESARLRSVETVAEQMWTAPGRGFICVSGNVYWRDIRGQNERELRYWRYLRENPRRFERVARFENWFLNRGFYRWLDPMYAGYTISPTIEFYRFQHPLLP